MLVASLKDGVPCRVLHAETPFEVRIWLRDWHNKFHNGSGYSCLDCLSDILSVIQPKWLVHKETIGLKARGNVDGMSSWKYYWEWINKHYPGYVDSWQQFDQGRLFTKFVTDMMPWDEFKQCLSPHIDFGKATSMQSIKTFAVLNQIRVMMTGIFASSMPSWLQIIVVIELCKYCVPLAAQVDDAEEKGATDKKDANDDVDHHCDIQMLFTDAVQTKTMLDDACFAPMAGSVAVKLRQKNAQNAQNKKKENPQPSPI